MDNTVLTFLGSLGQVSAVLVAGYGLLIYFQKRDEVSQKAQQEIDLRREKFQDDRDSRYREMFVMLQGNFEELSKEASTDRRENTAVVQRNNMLTQKLVDTMIGLISVQSGASKSTAEMTKATTELKEAIREQTP